MFVFISFHIFPRKLILSQDAVPAGVIDILTAAVRPSGENLFEIITPARIYSLCASSEREKQEWMERLKEVIELYENVDETGLVFAT